MDRNKRDGRQRHPSAMPRLKRGGQDKKLWKQELFPDQLPVLPAAEPEPPKPIADEDLPPPVQAGDIIEDILEAAPAGEGVQRIEKPKRRSYKELLEWIGAFVGILIVAILVINYIAAPIRVDGQSMENTLHQDEFVLMIKYAYAIDPVQRFDIVACQYPGEYKSFVKRVVGLPGDTVELRGDSLLINGEAVEQPFPLRATPPEDFGPITVPDGHYFVLGDNRGNSQDSREEGPLPASSIQGRVRRVVYPFSSARAL